MKHRFLAFVAAGLASAPAWGAQLQNTFVSGKGADTGNCAMATPCRSFQYALSQTLSNGTLSALDSAGYGAIVVERSVKITAPPGVVAVATAAAGYGQNAVYVGNAVGFNLEGLTLDGPLYVDSVPYGTRSVGYVTRCTVRSGGIQFANNGQLTITDSTILGDVSLAVTRGYNVDGSIIRSTISGRVATSVAMDFVTFGTTEITDSSIGSFFVYDNVSTSYTVKIVRSNAGTVSLGERDIAYLTASSIDSLLIQGQAVAHSSGDNDIISVSGNLQALSKR